MYRWKGTVMAPKLGGSKDAITMIAKSTLGAVDEV
jgi:hypothetical protein